MDIETQAFYEAIKKSKDLTSKLEKYQGYLNTALVLMMAIILMLVILMMRSFGWV